MGRIISNLVVLYLMHFPLMMFAQIQPKHPMKMYKGEDGKLYANKHQPMYLFLGTSPNPTDGVQKLESPTMPQYSNPFYLDTEGLNTLRTPSQVDTVTKQVVYPIADILFEVYADGLAPVTKAIFYNSSKHIMDGNVFYGKKATLTLNANDETSGIEAVYYSINDEPYKKYNDTIRFASEGEYALSYYSVDNVGNAETLVNQSFFIDVSAPVINWYLDGDVHGQGASARSRIMIDAADEKSGVKDVFYQVNNSPVKKYNGGISLALLDGGKSELKFWAVDNVGNKSENMDGLGDSNTSYSFIVDNTAPTTKWHIVGDYYKGKQEFLSPRSACKLTAEDDLIGINKIIYSRNSALLDEIYKEPLQFADIKGLHTIWFQAFDMVANKSVVDHVTFFVDNEEPLTRLNINGPESFDRDTLFISKTTSVSLQAADKDDGILTTEYKLNDGDWVKSNKIEFKKGGFQKIIFRSIDNVNNKEQDKVSEMFIDEGVPEIFVNFSIKPLRQEVGEGGETINVFPPYVKIYMAATDKECGTQDIFYSIGNGPRTKYTGVNSSSDSHLFSVEKEYSVKVEATDRLGNVAFKTIKFKVAKK